MIGSPIITGITEEMLKSAGEPIEQAVIHSDIQGIVFLTMQSGNIRVYNSSLQKTLKREFANADMARNWLIAKKILEVK